MTQRQSGRQEGQAQQGQAQQGQTSQGAQATGSQAPSQGRGDATAGTAGRTEAGRAAGTSGTSAAAGAPVTDASALRGVDNDMVGRQVDVDRVKVLRVEGDHGFWIETGGPGIFVLPAGDQQTAVRQGQTVSIEGVILEMPRRMRESAREGNSNERIYIYARSVQ
jgi:hypothetical protein